MQAGVPTVAGELADAIARSARLAEPPAVVCAGRTDAGVHAVGQVAHVDLPATYEGDLARAVNRQLSPKIVVRSAAPVERDFDARRSATSRHYRYLVWNAPVPNPLLAGMAWYVAEPLDLKTMASASDPLLGEHDFRAFCRRAPNRPATEPIVRRVTRARWRAVPATAVWAGEAGPAPPEGQAGPAPPEGQAAPAGQAPPALLRFDVVAGSFCHQMVRSIVAVLVDAGRGKATAATVMALLAAGDRAGSPRPAPAHGLCLVGVGYAGEEGGGRAG